MILNLFFGLLLELWGGHTDNGFNQLSDVRVMGPWKAAS